MIGVNDNLYQVAFKNRIKMSRRRRRWHTQKYVEETDDDCALLYEWRRLGIIWCSSTNRNTAYSWRMPKRRPQKETDGIRSII